MPQEPYVSPAAVLSTASFRGAGRTLRLLAVGISDELRRLINRYTSFKLPPVYLRLVAPITDPNALALLPLQVISNDGNGVTSGLVVMLGYSQHGLGRVVVWSCNVRQGRTYKLA